MIYKTQRNLSVGLSILSALGVVGTTVLAIKETPKAIKELESKKGSKLTKKDYVKILLPIYWPTLVVGTATISSITASNLLSRKAEASLIATTAMLNQGWMRYKHKVKEVFGVDADKLISTKVSADEYKEKGMKPAKEYSGKMLYWEEHIGFFVCDEFDFLSAVTDMNQRLHSPDPDDNGTYFFTTLEFFLKDAKATVVDPKKLEACRNMGWTADYLYDVYGCNRIWIHPHYTRVFDKNTGELRYIKVGFWEDPIELFGQETDRLHFKSREDYEHEAECDLHDADALAMYTHGFQDHMEEYEPDSRYAADIANYPPMAKVDCDRMNDDLNRLMLSNPKESFNHEDVYIDENDEIYKEIPNVEELGVK